MAVERIEMRVTPEVAGQEHLLKKAISQKSGIAAERICRIDIIRRSIDARQRQVMVLLTIDVHVDTVDSTAPANIHQEEYKPLDKDAPQAVVVGAGPAGLFAALRLIQEGIKPIVLERGKDVDSRRKDLAKINRQGTVDSNSNYCFGEGGAGAYSDGKLYTRSKKRGSVNKILNIFHQHGAQESILVDAHPHIGSDRLPAVIRNIRQTILDCGGEVHFGTLVKSLKTEKDDKGELSVTGVVDAEGKNWEGPVILATGHSARDVYSMLEKQSIPLQCKGIAVGVRLEHPQELIDCIQYHNPQGRGRWLPAAEYSMLTRVDGRAVYSFCMCPGGFIVPAASAPGEMVVNGMSPANRGTRWANSGMVVEVLPEDVPGEGPLRLMHFQQEIERKFFENANGTQNAPAQRMTDFVDGRESKDLPSTSYAPGIHPARMDQLLPAPIARRLKAGFREFGRKSRGFLSPAATLIGCETRTSSPVRIPRNPENMQHIHVSGLYPCGEGAGYAGGIVSAAIDGENSAHAVATFLKM